MGQVKLLKTPGDNGPAPLPWRPTRHLAGIVLAVVALVLLLAAAIPALAASHPTGTKIGPGDENRGDIWVDTVGAPPGPGHEQDPHLPCADINLWGDKMGDPSGTYQIFSWPPSGSKTVAYSSTWRYNQAQGGSQIMDVINHTLLIANAPGSRRIAPAAAGLPFLD